MPHSPESAPFSYSETAPTLPEHRQRAIARYLELSRRRPELFATRELRPLILNFEELVAIARQRWLRDGEEGPVIGLAAQSPWHLFLTDVIRLPNGQFTTYDRLLPTSLLHGRHGVAVVAMARDESGALGLVLVEQERHATGQRHWEIPRGFGEANPTGDKLAMEELESEAGFTGEVIKRLATMHTNSGQTAEQVDYYLIDSTPMANARPEASEAITGARIWPLPDLWRAIQSGEITDAFTLNGLALFERYIADSEHQGGDEGADSIP